MMCIPRPAEYYYNTCNTQILHKQEPNRLSQKVQVTPIAAKDARGQAGSPTNNCTCTPVNFSKFLLSPTLYIKTPKANQRKISNQILYVYQANNASALRIPTTWSDQSLALFRDTKLVSIQVECMHSAYTMPNHNCRITT
jgi:hypothetical protein